MNMKELESLVITQGRYIQEANAAVRALQEALDNVTGRIDRQTEGFTAKVTALETALSDARDCMNGMNDTLAGVYETNQQVMGDVKRLEDFIGAGEADGPFYAEFQSLKSKLEDVAAKVEGRNKSAAVKRNMTDADALEVLTGKYKDLGHKEAAEEIGLTYAQVYSCRLCFTFKHVHNKLEKGNWKSPWARV